MGNGKGRVVNVKLTDSEDVVQMLATKKENSHYGEGDNRRYLYSLTVFINGDYLRNFVLLEDDVVSLKSGHYNKCVDDLGYVLMTSKHKLRIMCNWGTYTHKDSEMMTKWKGNLGYGHINMNIFDDLSVYSESVGAFSRALRYVVECPFEGQQLLTELPPEEERIVVSL